MDKDRVKSFADRVFGDMAGAMVAGMGYVGVKTGLFRAMAGKGALSLDGVVQASGLHRRYVEEWLKGMACAGYLEYDPVAETFRLPDEHTFLLASEGTDHFMGGLFFMAPVLLRAAPKVADAFHTGGGVQFRDFGPEGVFGLDAVNRGAYQQRLASYWLKSLPDVVDRLENGGRALDVGCGAGRVCIVLAKAFPKAEIVGIDPDPESIRQAGTAAAEVDGRIRFLTKTTAQMNGEGSFDLVTAFDCLHDFAAPEKTLAEIRSLLKPDGTFFIVEPKAADRLEQNFHPIATMYYGFSLFHCMTQSLAQGGPGLGTCMGPARTEKLLHDAGFQRFAVLDIKSQVNSFYAARP
jgi:2-polyprenyl-3-methyl-5-hydroxy-6-metoxy-1,4-benzoquinol methylase